MNAGAPTGALCWPRLRTAVRFFAVLESNPVQPSLRHSSAFTQIRCTHPDSPFRGSPVGAPCFSRGATLHPPLHDSNAFAQSCCTHPDSFFRGSPVGAPCFSRGATLHPSLHDSNAFAQSCCTHPDSFFRGSPVGAPCFSRRSDPSPVSPGLKCVCLNSLYSSGFVLPRKPGGSALAGGATLQPSLRDSSAFA